MTNFPTNHYRSILQVILIYYRCFLAKTTFDIKGHFLVAMDNLQFPGRKNSFYYIKVHAGHWADH